MRPVGAMAGREQSASLVQEAAHPTDKRVELLGIDHEINDERHRGQHEYHVSHGIFPAPVCVLSTSQWISSITAV